MTDERCRARPKAVTSAGRRKPLVFSSVRTGRRDKESPAKANIKGQRQSARAGDEEKAKGDMRLPFTPQEDGVQTRQSCWEGNAPVLARPPTTIVAGWLCA